MTAKCVLNKSNKQAHIKITALLMELAQAVFDMSVPILGTLIRACPNLILSKTETTVKHNSSFLIKSARNLNIITRKYKISVMYS